MNKSGEKLKSKKRKVISEDDNLDHTPVSELINFGPVTLPEIESLGLRTLGDMRKMGWEEICRKWIVRFPERLNVNAFMGIIATLEGVVWTKISESQKARALRLVNELRSENNLPIVKVSKKNKPLQRNTKIK